MSATAGGVSVASARAGAKSVVSTRAGGVAVVSACAGAEASVQRWLVVLSWQRPVLSVRLVHWLLERPTRRPVVPVKRERVCTGIHLELDITFFAAA